MSVRKQNKSVRCWIPKLSGNSLTDVGYKVTLDSSMRAYREYDIRTLNRNKGQDIRGSSSESICKDCMSDRVESGLPDFMERLFLQGIQELTNFKESSNNLKDRMRIPKDEISWTQHNVDNQSLDKYNGVFCIKEDAGTSEIQVYEGHFYGCKHWNFYCVDDDIESVILSLKLELLHGKEYVR